MPDHARQSRRSASGGFGQGKTSSDTAVFDGPACRAVEGVSVALPAGKDGASVGVEHVDAPGKGYKLGGKPEHAVTPVLFTQRDGTASSVGGSHPKRAASQSSAEARTSIRSGDAESKALCTLRKETRPAPTEDYRSLRTLLPFTVRGGVTAPHGGGAISSSRQL